MMKMFKRVLAVVLACAMLLTLCATAFAATTPGDVNDDGAISLVDVVLVMREVAGGYTQTINKAAANVDGDNAVTVADALLIAKKIVGYDVELLPETAVDTGVGDNDKPWPWEE